jgi:hypothetical protein
MRIPKLLWVMGYYGFMAFKAATNLVDPKKYGLLQVMGFHGYGLRQVLLYVSGLSLPVTVDR